MRRALRGVLLAVVVACLMAASTAGFVWWRYGAAGPSPAPVTLLIPRGSGVADIARQLAAANVLADAYTLRFGSRLDGTARRFKAGEYAFAAGISPAAIAALLANGRTVVRRLVVPEGLTTAQVLALARAAEGLEGEIAIVPGEGELMPDTYYYSWGDSRAQIVERQRRAMAETLAALWPGRAPDLPYKAPAEAAVLASIVEKETARDEERPHVAAVFVNRLKRGMKLQADPTVVYGLSGGQGPLDRPLTRADLDTAHRWNTYVIDGLPPTPIANPGRAALAAILHPAASEDLYFVADGKGGHVFARTLAEHNRNVARLRQVERNRGGTTE
ncbi:MAG: endolytic transglycosylase MltG [Proteobacteria bacterium]|nr:endolytic transglycosylase MltG [Pseudomonadota bacterium]